MTAMRRLVLALLPLMAASCLQQGEDRTFRGSTMGTTWSLRVGSSAPYELQALVQTHLDAREAMLSHWRTDSVVSRFNASASTDWFPVPAEVVKLVQLARRISDATGGVLDITLGPVIELWGFGAGGRPRQQLPADAEIDAARKKCGWQHLQWRLDPPALRKTIPELRIDLAAVTEGFVVDELAAMLRTRGIRRFLLNVGGEIAAADGPWNVGIQLPDAPEGESLHTLPLSDQCLATSGIYRQRYLIGGKSYAHLIDPRIGRPIIGSRLQSVSVIHDDCAMADGLATALMILGSVDGRAIARRLGLRVVWVEE